MAERATGSSRQVTTRFPIGVSDGLFVALLRSVFTQRWWELLLFPRPGDDDVGSRENEPRPDFHLKLQYVRGGECL